MTLESPKASQVSPRVPKIWSRVRPFMEIIERLMVFSMTSSAHQGSSKDSEGGSTDPQGGPKGVPRAPKDVLGTPRATPGHPNGLHGTS